MATSRINLCSTPAWIAMVPADLRGLELRGERCEVCGAKGIEQPEPRFLNERPVWMAPALQEICEGWRVVGCSFVYGLLLRERRTTTPPVLPIA